MLNVQSLEEQNPALALMIQDHLKNHGTVPGLTSIGKYMRKSAMSEGIAIQIWIGKIDDEISAKKPVVFS